jgi:hypothetical protein
MSPKPGARGGMFRTTFRHGAWFTITSASGRSWASGKNSTTPCLRTKIQIVAYMNTEEIDQGTIKPVVNESPPLPIFTPTQRRTFSNENFPIVHKTKRQVSDRLRFRVFYRDGMTCKICRDLDVPKPGKT